MEIWGERTSWAAPCWSTGARRRGSDVGEGSSSWSPGARMVGGLRGGAWWEVAGKQEAYRIQAAARRDGETGGAWPSAWLRGVPDPGGMASSAVQQGRGRGVVWEPGEGQPPSGRRAWMGRAARRSGELWRSTGTAAGWGNHGGLGNWIERAGGRRRAIRSGLVRAGGRNGYDGSVSG